MKSNIRTRLVSGFLAAMMGLSCFSGTAIAAYADDANSEITVSSTAESDQKSVVVDDESAPPENAATDDVSETVKAFLEAVDKINYESILAKANSFGLAQKKWEVNQDDKDLEKQLDEVISELDEATQPLYTAEDAYSELSEDEKAMENGQYLLVETTVPEDKFQADPVIIDVDPDSSVVPVSRFSDSKGAVETPSGSYMKYTILNELVEAYLRIVKIDDETGKPVLREGTAFQLYWIDDNGNYILDKKGNPRLVTMTATADDSAVKKIDTFYTTADGIIVLPEKLEVGRYRIVEVNGPEGFYNEWVDTAQYGENGILLDKDDNGVYSTGEYYVDFAVTTNRIYEATGDLNEDNQDNLLIEEEYFNHETLGKVIIRKTGEVLTGFKDGKFTYEEQPLAGAEFKIIAAEDILTQDNQVDANGNRTVWYKAGDVVATVTSGDGTADTVVFAPTRTKATYDFLSVIHDGAVGEVAVTLPLGKYKIVETKPPYGYVLNETQYDVEFDWTNQIQDVNFSTEIKQTVQLESDLFEVPAYSHVTLPFEEYTEPSTPADGEESNVVTQAAFAEYRDCIMGDVNLDGQITEEDALMIRDYLDEQTYMKEFAQKAQKDLLQFIKDHPDEPVPAVEVYSAVNAASF